MVFNPPRGPRAMYPGGNPPEHVDPFTDDPAKRSSNTGQNTMMPNMRLSFGKPALQKINYKNDESSPGASARRCRRRRRTYSKSHNSAHFPQGLDDHVGHRDSQQAFPGASHDHNTAVHGNDNAALAEGPQTAEPQADAAQFVEEYFMAGAPATSASPNEWQDTYGKQDAATTPHMNWMGTESWLAPIELLSEHAKIYNLKKPKDHHRHRRNLERATSDDGEPFTHKHAVSPAPWDRRPGTTKSTVVTTQPLQKVELPEEQWMECVICGDFNKETHKSERLAKEMCLACDQHRIMISPSSQLCPQSDCQYLVENLEKPAATCQECSHIFCWECNQPWVGVQVALPKPTYKHATTEETCWHCQEEDQKNAREEAQIKKDCEVYSAKKWGPKGPSKWTKGIPASLIGHIGAHHKHKPSTMPTGVPDNFLAFLDNEEFYEDLMATSEYGEWEAQSSGSVNDLKKAKKENIADMEESFEKFKKERAERLAAKEYKAKKKAKKHWEKADFTPMPSYLCDVETATYVEWKGDGEDGTNRWKMFDGDFRE
ncbi:hypothetical protein EJ08DRAFT_694427 [Tothia fuscella]|uniref:IBR domain-containing protein n=1 Tax=Tothia fuscella TaxID=1048955 RepID=A0A9P4U1J2_9PEZI|nr:hypothetical protein EJ08DRAFT_694427 [Tothia fuscella]